VTAEVSQPQQKTSFHISLQWDFLRDKTAWVHRRSPAKPKMHFKMKQ